ncbi:cell cycle transcriptional regulator TrcR [Sphingomonas sp. MMS24-JH45]
MPHATASWMVDNTALSFEQIADFCGLHILEVQAIADDTAATKLTGAIVRAHEVTQEEIEQGAGRSRLPHEHDQGAGAGAPHQGPRYTPVSKRQDKPDGIAWIIRNHPEITDGQISLLIGTTRNTIAAIRDRSHWNIGNITPKDPVTSASHRSANSTPRCRRRRRPRGSRTIRPTPASMVTARR